MMNKEALPVSMGNDLSLHSRKCPTETIFALSQTGPFHLPSSSGIESENSTEYIMN